jgi:NDP-sugar pyrophosphorylase family protein
VQFISVVDNNHAQRADGTCQLLEKAILEYARGGVEHILILELSSYTEFNLNELLQFHRESGCPVTNVIDDRGPLGITLLSVSALDGNSSISNRLSALSSCSATYEFSGFVHRLSSVADYRELVRCTLAGLCQAKPVGVEVRPGVWIAEGADIHGSVRTFGPCFIGHKSRVRAGSVIAPGAAIERLCEIDCGTVVEGSSILPNTYVAPGLRVSNAVVQGSRFTHLGRNIELELAATGLIDSTEKRRSHRLLQTLGSVFAFGGSASRDLPAPSTAPASLDYVRSNSFTE